MKVILFVIIVISNFYSLSQNQTIDSLNHRLVQRLSKKERAQTLIELAMESGYVNNDSAALQILSEVEALNENLNHWKIKVDFHYTKGIIYRNLNQLKEAIDEHYSAIRDAKPANNDKYLHYVKNYSAIAIAHGYLGNQDEAEQVHQKIKGFVKKLDNSKIEHGQIKSNWYNDYAIFHFGKSQNKSGIIYFRKCLKERIRLNQDPRMILQSYQNLGMALDWSDSTESAIKVYQKGLRYCKKNKQDPKDIFSKLGSLFLTQKNYVESRRYSFQAIGDNDKINAIAYNNIAVSYLNEEQFTEAKKYLYLSLSEGEKTDLPRQLSLKYENLGLIYLDSKENLDSAEFYLNKGLKLAYQTHQPERICASQMNYGQVLNVLGRYKESIDLLSSAYSSSDSLKITDQKLECALHLFHAYEGLNDFKNALKWYKEHQSILNKYDSIRKRKEVNDLNLKYKTEQKENRILQLSNANNLEKARTASLKLWIYGILGGGLFLLLATFFLWNRRKQKHKLQTLNASVQASDKEKKRIGKELHDGIANELISFFYKIEDSDPEIAHQILTSYERVRNVSHQLDNTAPHGTLLSERILDLIPEKDIEMIINITPQHLVLDEPIGTHIYRITQELIVNTQKHSHASQIDLLVKANDESLLFIVQDNGTGSKEFSAGNGHKNISDRVQLMNGTIKVNSDHESGFKIEIIIPLK